MLTNRFWWLYCICVEECPSLKEIHTKVFKDDGSLGGQLTPNDSGEKKFFILGFQLVCSFFQNQTKDFNTYAWASPLESLVPFEVRSRHVHLLKAPRVFASCSQCWDLSVWTLHKLSHFTKEWTEFRWQVKGCAPGRTDSRTQDFRFQVDSLIHFIDIILTGPCPGYFGEKKTQ